MCFLKGGYSRYETYLIPGETLIPGERGEGGRGEASPFPASNFIQSIASRRAEKNRCFLGLIFGGGNRDNSAAMLL